MTGVGDLPLRDDLRGLTAYGAPQLNVAIRLNTNENPYPPPAELVDDLRESVTAAATSMNRYPDRDAVELRTELASYLGHDLDVSRRSGRPTAPTRCCSNCCRRSAARAHRARLRAVVLDAPADRDRDRHHLAGIAARRGLHVVGSDAAAAVQQHAPDVVFLCSPNNPTATALDPSVLAAVLDEAPGMVVVDEAYAEFSHRPSLLPSLAGQPRLVVTRTMSKAFAFAAARLGYLAADPAVVDALRLVRLPYHLSALTQAAALAALRHADETLAQVAQLRADRDVMVRSLTDRGFDVVDSDANFVLFGGFADEKAVWQALLDQGVLVRDVGSTRLAAGQHRHGCGVRGVRRCPGRRQDQPRLRDRAPWARRAAPEHHLVAIRSGLRQWKRESQREGRAVDQGVAGPRVAGPRRHRHVRRRDRGAVLRPHAGAAVEAQRHRPRRADDRRPRGRQPPHRGGHVDRAGPGAA